MTQDARNEFAGVQLGDWRRARRLRQIVKALQARPTSSFPQALGTRAGSEAFYRFVEHDEVTFEALFAAHSEASATRCDEQEEVLVVHDSTSFLFNGARKGLGKIYRTGQGFHAHFSLAISADGRRKPYGVLAVRPWVRTGPAPTARRRAGELSVAQARKLPRESARWMVGVEQAVAALSDSNVSAVHVMDSEADDFSLMAPLAEKGRRFVIRSFQDRTMPEEILGTNKLRKFIASATVACSRSVKLSRRINPAFAHRRRTQPREGRPAELTFRAMSAEIQRPTHCDPGLPPTLKLNVVLVQEANPPPDVEPVDWVLFTTEPIDTEQAILRIVDFYRARWVIEEFFKALKTGCAFEKRQLESFHTLQNALALFIPIAWNLLRLRSLARDFPGLPATIVLTPTEIEVLFRTGRIKSKTVDMRDAMLGVASLGGHLRNNGPPGWMVLGRGYQQLVAMAAGFLLARASSDQS